jgi:hypothetical protein
MATLSTTAWVLHELGLAAGFGGNLFGQLALNPALKTIQSKRERGKVTHVAWDRYKRVNEVSLLMMAGTWLAERTLLDSRRLRRSPHGLIIAKDVLVAGALVTGAGAVVLGHLLDKEIAVSNEPLQVTSRPAAATRQRVADLHKLANVFGRMNVVLNAAVLAVSSLLALKR